MYGRGSLTPFNSPLLTFTEQGQLHGHDRDLGLNELVARTTATEERRCTRLLAEQKETYVPGLSTTDLWRFPRVQWKSWLVFS
jgi:hypothetical protein